MLGRGEGVKSGGSLPVEVERALKRSRRKEGVEQFHGTEDVLLAQSVLAGAGEPTALRDRGDLQLNSLSSSCTEGVPSADCPGVGRVVGLVGETAQGAEDSGSPQTKSVSPLPSEGSGRKMALAVQQKVSPRDFRQLMSLARSMLYDGECERMQNTVEDTSYVADDIFPLPLPLKPGANSELACADMIYGLNLFACGKGEGHRPKREPCGIVENLVEVCDRFKVWDVTLGNLDFADFFAKRGVTYDGEEVRVAQTLTWEGVRSSLPDEVGQLDLRDFCTQGTLHYLEHFEEHLIDSSDLPCPKAPRVMVGDDWPSICEGLIKKNICEVMPVDELFHINQVPLLNGMFGVGKGEFVGEIETQRLIMNLVPLNGLCEPLVGDVCTLPNICSFGTFLLDDGEVALPSSEDIRCFFYLFKIPPAWKKFLGFNRPVPPSLVPEEWQGRPCVLTSCVLPMGFINSVSIAQHVHRNIVAWSQQVEGGLGQGCEMRKDRVSSSAKSQYRVYLDNFDLVERLDPATAAALEGQVANTVEDLREQYAAQNIPRHPKKAVVRAPVAEIQGAIVDGVAGFAQPKANKIALYCQLALMLVEQGQCTLKELQVSNVFFQLKGVRQKWNLLSFRESKCVKLLVLRKLAKAPCAALEHFEPRKQIAKAGRCYDYCCRNHTKPKSKLIHAKARESSAKAPRKHLQPPSNPCPFQGPGTF